MKDYKCLVCKQMIKTTDDKAVVKCPNCGSERIKRLWTTSLKSGGKYTYKNGYGLKLENMENKNES